MKSILGDLLERIGKSVTSYEYKVTLYRWSVYRQIMLQWNSDHSVAPMRRVLCLDGDVLM